MTNEDRNDVTYERVSVHSLVGNLPELFLREFLAKGRTALIIDVDRLVTHGRYVQLLAREDDHLVVECVSNNYLDAPFELSLDQELALVNLGFEPAEGPESDHPNFWFHAEGIGATMDACKLAARALTEVFALPPEWPVNLIRRPIELPLA
jgi:hypothetical protein